MPARRGPYVSSSRAAGLTDTMKDLGEAVRGKGGPEAWDVTSAFGQVNGNIGVYLPIGKDLTFATRVGGKHAFGTYP